MSNKAYRKQLNSSVAVIFLVLTVVFIGAAIHSSSGNPYEYTDSSESLDSTDKTTSDNETTQEAIDAARQQIADELGIDVSNIKVSDTTQLESGGTVLGSAKKVKNYKSLADAESDMGYYLGLHNKIDSLRGYELVGMYKIADSWYQAVFECSDKPSITVKTSKEASLKDLTDAYTSEYNVVDTDNIKGIDVTSKSDADGTVHLMYFETINNKKYTIFSTDGIDSLDAVNLVTELITNIKGMDDWVD